jgi:hypothetical protein
MLVRIGMVMLLIGGLSATVHSQGKGSLPSTRPPIFLNNNASLYTFPNPNFGKPGQLAFAFVAVAHEDCRLFNNGATLMPKHRLMAANCMQGGASGGMNGGTTVIDPLTGLPISTFPTNGGNVQGINYRRARLQQMMMAAQAYGGYGYGGYGYGQAQSYNYPVQPEPMLTNSSSDGDASTATVAQSKQFKGFGFLRDYRYGGFSVLHTEQGRDFGKGFQADDKEKEKDEEKK